MANNNLNESDLAHFTGTETWHRHMTGATFTDGVKYVADKGGAYWLIDEILFAQKFEKSVKAQPFQVWKLAVKDNSATLTCEDGNYNVVYEKPIAYTDFPMAEVKFYFTDNVLMLPSEY
jgi:hypothetical protein